MDNKFKIRPFADKYIQEKREWGQDADIEPVDINGAFIPVDKYAKDNLERTQENINWRLQTKPVYPFETQEVKK